jgi:hypothetical protein
MKRRSVGTGENDQSRVAASRFVYLNVMRLQKLS